MEDSSCQASKHGDYDLNYVHPVLINISSLGNGPGGIAFGQESTVPNDEAIGVESADPRRNRRLVSG